MSSCSSGATRVSRCVELQWLPFRPLCARLLASFELRVKGIKTFEALGEDLLIR